MPHSTFDPLDRPRYDESEGEVLFATIAAGGGHVATANAMAEAVQEESGGRLRTRVSDAMAEYGAGDLDRRHKRAWRRMLARPALVRLGQHLTDALPAVTRGVHNALLDGFAAGVAEALNEEQPRLVVVNHGWLATAFTRAKTRFGLVPPVVIFATEPFDASALWSTPRASAVLAPSAAARSDLIDLGVRAESVFVAGYPVARRFTTAPTRGAARAELGLPQRFTCLVSLGAEGVTGGSGASSGSGAAGSGGGSGGDAVSAIKALLDAGVEVIAVCGRNEELELRLRALGAAGANGASAGAAGSSGTGARLHVHGFATNMETLLAAADVVAGKAGPASTMEALAVGRPVLAAAYAGLNERAVIRFLEAYALGGYSGGFAGLPATVLAWRADEPRRLAAAEAAASLGFGPAREGIGRFLTAYADRRSEPERLLAPGSLALVSRERLHAGPRPPPASDPQPDRTAEAGASRR